MEELNLNKFTLSIVIPTYNRSKYLERALNSINEQLEEFNNDIEVFVSDNASTDNTKYILEKFEKTFKCNFSYSINKENFGSSFNIIKVIKSARGKYTLVLGDDDVIVYGTLIKVINFLNIQENTSLISLGTKGCNVINKSDYFKYNPKKIRYITFFSYADFIRYVNVQLSFTSSIIFESSFANSNLLEEIKGSNLPNIAIILNALISKQKTQSILNTIILGQNGNNSGYNSFDIFNNELYDMTMKKSIINFNFSRLFSKVFLQYLHPYDYYHFRINNTKNDTNEKIWKQYSYLKNYFEYWFFLWPMRYFPNYLLKPIFLIFKFYVKSLKLINIIKYKHKLNKF